MENKIAIVDFVGTKAGMDYYNLELLKSLQTVGFDPFLFSNEKLHFKGLKSFKIYAKNTPSKNWNKLTDYFGGTLLGGFGARINGVKLVIFHFFSATPKEYFAIKVLKGFGVQIVLIAHDVSAFAHSENSKIKNYIFSKSDKIVVHNKFSKKEINRLFGSNFDHKIFEIPHGSYVNLTYQYTENKEEAKKKISLDPNKKYILFFGQIKKVKGLEILLRAMPTINKKINLIIAGKPWKNDFEQYQKIITDLNLSHRILPIIKFIPDELRHTLFMACDGLIIPYREIYQSGVLIMGMSYGIPVIASDLEGNKEMIDDGENGILFQTENYKDLSEKVNNLFFGKESLANKLSKNARQTMEKDYSWDEIAQKYTKIL